MTDFKNRKGRNPSRDRSPATVLGHDDQVCAGHKGGFPLRHKFKFHDIEDLTLDVMRCLCDVYGTGSGQGWDIALMHAEAQIGPSDGPLLVARVTSFIRALRRERRGGFKYLGFGCQHICDDELAILTLVKAMRVGDHACARRALQAVTLDSVAHVQTERAGAELGTTLRALIAEPDFSQSASIVKLPVRHLH